MMAGKRAGFRVAFQGELGAFSQQAIRQFFGAKAKPIPRPRFDEVFAALKKGERVTIVGFGTFNVSQRKARNGRNPQTGSLIKIAARRVAKFTPGIELKKAVSRNK